MATSTAIDITEEFLANDLYITSGSLWDYYVIQTVNLEGQIDVTGTNDGGAITGIRDGSSQTATNFNSILVEDLSAGTSANKIITSGSFRINSPVTNYIKLEKSGVVTADKIIIYFSKIY